MTYRAYAFVASPADVATNALRLPIATLFPTVGECRVGATQLLVFAALIRGRDLSTLAHERGSSIVFVRAAKRYFPVVRDLSAEWGGIRATALSSCGSRLGTRVNSPGSLMSNCIATAARGPACRGGVGWQETARLVLGRLPASSCICATSPIWRRAPMRGERSICGEERSDDPTTRHEFSHSEAGTVTLLF
jgi:hypothetical protein